MQWLHAAVHRLVVSTVIVAGSKTRATAPVYHTGMAGDDPAKEIQALNRGVDRVALRERKLELSRGGPERIDGNDAEGVRTELCELSIFFIEDVWPQLTGLLTGQQALLLRPAGSGRGFVPLLQSELSAAHIDDGGATPDGTDALTRIAIYVEILLRGLGHYTEHRKAHLPASTIPAALHGRYRDLLSQLSPPETPTGHAMVNALAGMQVTLGFCELIPLLHGRTHGKAIDAATFVGMLRSADLQRLTLAVAATRSQASNAILAELMGDAFATWCHSLLPSLDGRRSARLRFLPERFALRTYASHQPAALTFAPDVMSRVRRLIEAIETPGRTRQIMCPAFFADVVGDTSVSVIQDFVTWLLSIVEHYYVPLVTSLPAGGESTL